MTSPALPTSPLTPDAWEDFETVMGRRGGARGRQRVHWRLSGSEWTHHKGEGDKTAMRALTDTAMTGVASAFDVAGFTEIARPKQDRPVMRYQLS